MAKWISLIPKQWWETMGDWATADVDCSRWRHCSKLFQNILSHPHLNQMLRKSSFFKLGESSYDSEFAIISKITYLRLCKSLEGCRYPIVESNKYAANWNWADSAEQNLLLCSTNSNPEGLFKCRNVNAALAHPEFCMETKSVPYSNNGLVLK